MGTSVKPSFTRHRGYRTRDQPPARGARRTGCSASDRLVPVTDVGRSSIKKPAAHRAAGFDHGHHPEGGADIRRRTVHLHPPFVAAGGLPCGDACYRVVFAHSLPQGTSAGRNVITVFSTVNNPQQSFFRCVHRQPGGEHTSRRRNTHVASPRSTRMISNDRLQASTGAACSQSGKRIARKLPANGRARHVATNFHQRCRPRPGAAHACGFDFASHKPVCAKTARTFPVSKDANRSCTPEKENPRRLRRGFRIAACASRLNGRLRAPRHRRRDRAVP